MTTIGTIQFIEMFSEIAVAMTEQREWLCGLDGVDGDGDHGTTMDRAFSEIETTIASLNPAKTEAGALFDVAAETFLRIDAASARLYASAFRRAGSALLGRKRVDVGDLGRALSALATAVNEHGTPGRRLRNITDIWLTAINAYRAREEAGGSIGDCLNAALATTKNSSGLNFNGMDAGGASATLMLRAMRDALA